MKIHKYIAVIILGLLTGNFAWGMFVLPNYAPVERLIKNTQAFVAEHPDNAHGYYTLGRIHYLAFANKAFEVGIWGQDEPSRIAPDWILGGYSNHTRMKRATELTLKEFGYSNRGAVPKKERDRFYKAISQKEQHLKKQGWEHEKPDDKELAKHAAAAYRNFNKSVELDPHNGLYHLGLASLLEQYVGFLGDGDLIPGEFREILLDKAKETYFAAYELSVRKDVKLKHLPISGLRSLVSHEAGKAYVRLSESEDDQTKDQKKKLASVKKNLAALDKLIPESITPIILSLEEKQRMSDLLAPKVNIRFDLDGDGFVEMRSWVKPTTGFLVWDPGNKGIITSGRQMFGAVSWWLFFEDGYHALDALDDDRNGRLVGSELNGLSVWFDRNSDGKSEKSEVTAVSQLGIVSIAAKSAGDEDGCPMNSDGVSLNSGESVATYDWIAPPVD